MGTFGSVEDVLNWIDPHDERIWLTNEDPEGAELRVSNTFAPGSVRDRISRIAISWP